MTPGRRVAHSIADHANGARNPPLTRCTLRMGMHMNLLVHVQANGHSVACGYVVIATHVPIMGKSGLVSASLFQTKLASYSSFVVGAKAPRETFPESLFWDTADPYHASVLMHADNRVVASIGNVEVRAVIQGCIARPLEFVEVSLNRRKIDRQIQPRRADATN